MKMMMILYSGVSGRIHKLNLAFLVAHASTNLSALYTYKLHVTSLGFLKHEKHNDCQVNQDLISYSHRNCGV